MEICRASAVRKDAGATHSGISQYPLLKACTEHAGVAGQGTNAVTAHSSTFVTVGEV